MFRRSETAISVQPSHGLGGGVGGDGETEDWKSMVLVIAYVGATMTVHRLGKRIWEQLLQWLLQSAVDEHD